jgi:glycine/D-amino acid oxidase-like deaminating enzyme
LGYDIKLRQIGYLWLFSKSQYTNLKSIFQTIKGRGADIKTFSRRELEQIIPHLRTNFSGDKDAKLMGLEPVDIGVQGIKCGCIDASALIQSIEREFLKLGGETHYNVEANRLILKPKIELGILGEPFVWQESNITGAETNFGEYKADTTIIATGTWSEKLLDPIGFHCLMKPKKRQIFVFKNSKLNEFFKVKKINK